MNPFAPIPEATANPQPSWGRTFGGVWRLTYRRTLHGKGVIIFAVLVLLFAALALAGVREHVLESFRQWASHFYLGFLLPVTVFLSTAGLIQDDLTPATTDYVFTRSMRRWVFVLARYLSHVTCLQVQALIAFLALVAVGLFRQVPDLDVALPSLLAAQVLGVFAFGALGLAFGVVTHRYLVLGLMYGSTVEIGIGNIPTPVNRLALSHHVRTIASGGSSGTVWFGSPDSMTTAWVSLVVFSLLLVGIAMLVFTVRELAGAKPKDA